ncbi:MAG: DNA polymerase III subunit delta [Demequinaceae bacterium]|nr:DNA polymerase III subunit delta [Demequinaceae bacterium]
MTASESRRVGSWVEAAPAPLVLVIGPEELLSVRAVEAIVSAVRGAQGSVAVTAFSAAASSRGDLRAATSPSLFAEPGVVVVEEGEAMNDEFLKDAVDYALSPDPDVVVILRHSGAVRGKRALEAWRAAGASEFLCPAVKRDSELVEFVEGEFTRARREVRPQAVRALVDAVGGDVSELAGACRQLLDDVAGPVTEEAVSTYYGSRVNATGFAVADAAIVGRTEEALTLVRHALDTGTDPVPLVAALASKLRTLATVGAARGRGLDPKAMGLAPWQVDRARRDLRHWEADSLARAIESVAYADAQIKGAGRDPQFAVEKAVRTVASLASH